MSETMIVGLEIVSTYSNGEPVLTMAASTAAKSVGSTNSVVTPSPASTRTRRSRVVPYTACVTTIVWPALTTETMAAWMAAMPDANASPASAPSSSATASARAAVVGLSIRLYA